MRKNIFVSLKHFVIFFIFFILLAQVAFIFPQYARAAGATGAWEEESTGSKILRGVGNLREEVIPEVSMPIGEFMKECNSCAKKEDYEARDACYKEFTNYPSKCFTAGHPENWLGQYILAWFHYAIGAIGIFAVMAIMWGGIKWITAGGNASQIDTAKTIIGNGVKGVVFLLCAYTILKTVNPRLLSLQLPKIEDITEPQQACCQEKTTPAYPSSKMGDCFVNKEVILKDGKCESNQWECYMKLCEDQAFLRAQLLKNKDCPLGFTGIITMTSNDIREFRIQAIQKCGGSIYIDDINDIIDLSKTSDSLIMKNGEIYGCYTCK